MHQEMVEEEEEKGGGHEGRESNADRGLGTQGRSNNPFLLIMDCLMLGSWKYLRSKCGGGGVIYP